MRSACILGRVKFLLNIVTSLVMDMAAHETLPVPECMASYLPPRE
jgi:hypothetical protein